MLRRLLQLVSNDPTMASSGLARGIKDGPGSDEGCKKVPECSSQSTERKRSAGHAHAGEETSIKETSKLKIRDRKGMMERVTDVMPAALTITASISLP